MKLSIFLVQIRECNIDLRRRVLDIIINSRNALSRKKKIFFCGEEDVFGSYVSKLVFSCRFFPEPDRQKTQGEEGDKSSLPSSPCLHSTSSPIPPRHLHQPEWERMEERVEQMCQSQLRPDVGIEEENSGEKHLKESKS